MILITHNYFVMIKGFVFLLYYFWGGFSQSVSPLRSNFGDSFRTGEVRVEVGTQVNYDFHAPYRYPLSSDSVTLALSMEEYNQTFDSASKIHFRLLENTPFPSNSTHATFRVQLGLVSLTSKAKVKYLACPTSILSPNFNIISNEYHPGTLSPRGTVDYYRQYKLESPLSILLYSYSIWMSGMEVWKPAPWNQFHLQVFYYNDPDKIVVYNMASNQMHFGRVKVTLVFIHSVGSIIHDSEDGEKLPFHKWFPSISSYPLSLARFGSWFDATNIICGIWALHFTDNFYQYAYLLEGNTVSFRSSVKPPPNYKASWSASQCLIAGLKMCPKTYPYYSIKEDLCFDSCPGQNKENYLCNCPSNCHNCTSAGVCTSCYPGYYLGQDKLCNSSCRDGTFPNPTTKICDACPVGCATCTSLTVCETCSQFCHKIDTFCDCLPSSLAGMAESRQKDE